MLEPLDEVDVEEAEISGEGGELPLVWAEQSEINEGQDEADEFDEEDFDDDFDDDFEEELEEEFDPEMDEADVVETDDDDIEVDIDEIDDDDDGFGAVDDEPELEDEGE